MEEKDLKQIKELFRQEVKTGFKEGFTEIWIGNLEPAFDSTHERIDKLDKKVDQLPTKSYLDDKFADLEGELIKKLRKEDEKVNRLAEILKEKKVLSDGDIAELQRLQVFPKS